VKLVQDLQRSLRAYDSMPDQWNRSNPASLHSLRPPLRRAGLFARGRCRTYRGQQQPGPRRAQRRTRSHLPHRSLHRYSRRPQWSPLGLGSPAVPRSTAMRRTLAARRTGHHHPGRAFPCHPHKSLSSRLSSANTLPPRPRHHHIIPRPRSTNPLCPPDARHIAVPHSLTIPTHTIRRRSLRLRSAPSCAPSPSLC
jgi:hypothetical protein